MADVSEGPITAAMVLRFSKNGTAKGLELRDTLGEEARYELSVLQKTRQDDRL